MLSTILLNGHHMSHNQVICSSLVFVCLYLNGRLAITTGINASQEK